MSWLLPLTVLAVGALFASIPVVFGVLCHRRAAAIAAMRLTRIAKLRSGAAKVKARVVARERLLRSPLGGRPCVYYRFVVEEIRTHTTSFGQGRSSQGTYFDTVVDDAQAIDVVLEDATGEADVELERADVTLQSERTEHSGVFNSPPERLRRVLQERYGRSTRGLLFNKSMRSTETVLEDGAEVVVVGEVVKGRDGRPRLVGGAVPLMVSDRGSQRVGGPYLRRAVACYVGAGFVLVFFGLLAFLAGSLAGDFARHEDPPPPPAAAPAAVADQPQPPDQPPAVAVAQPGQQPGGELDLLLAELRSPDPFQREQAARKAGEMRVVEERQPEVRAALEALLEDVNILVIRAALPAVEKWGGKDSVPTLARLLDKRDFPYRWELMLVLSRSQDERAAAALAARLDDPKEAGPASTALRGMGPVAEPAVLRQLETNKNLFVQRLACGLLCDLGTRASLPALERAAASPDLALSTEARRCRKVLLDRLQGQ
jgi:hypothetical protein